MGTSEIGLSIPYSSARFESHLARLEMKYLESNTSPGTTSDKVVPIAFAGVVLSGQAKAQSQRR